MVRKDKIDKKGILTDAKNATVVLYIIQSAHCLCNI
jgi:hypothetical protein